MVARKIHTPLIVIAHDFSNDGTFASRLVVENLNLLPGISQQAGRTRATDQNDKAQKE